MNTPPFPAISSPVSRHPAILRINLGGARRTEVTSATYSTSTFSKHANPPKRCLCHQPHRRGKRAGASASTGRGACSFYSSTRLMAEAALWWVGMLGKGGCATGCTCRLRASRAPYAQYSRVAGNR